jgi:hypothetical protein
VDAWGLKVSVVVAANAGNELMHRLYFCRNGSTFSIDSMDNDGHTASVSGCEFKSSYFIRIDAHSWNVVASWTGLKGFSSANRTSKSKHTTDKLQAGADCSSSDQCQDGCCSGVESNGVAKCTPVEGGYNSDMCIPSGLNGRYLRFVGMEENQPLN